jgi:hypothetical protein
MSCPLHPAAAGAQDADMNHRPPSLLLLLLLLAACAGSAAAQEDDITIYRCTDAKGQLTLQDSPCAKDHQQQTRRMLQPEDPPSRTTPAVAAPAPPPLAEPPRTVALGASQPMYECVRPDGGRYTSDDDAGNPRWTSSDWTDDALPAYSSGIVYSSAMAPVSGIAVANGNAARNTTGNGAPQLHFRNMPRAEPPPPPSRPGHGHGHGHGFGLGYGYGGGMWVRDECNALPRAETCARLRDRRDEIRHRFFNAQANERATLDNEERGINARLSDDCGGA